MFDTNREDVNELLMVNYFLIALETPVGFYLTYKFPEFELYMLVIIVCSTLIVNILLHITMLFNASKLTSDIALVVLATTIIAVLTTIMHFIPSIRSTLILSYVPAILFAASQCVSFGVVTTGIVVLFFAVLTGGEYFNFYPFSNSTVDFKSLGSLWSVSNYISFFFILILAFMSNYFFEILRRREKKIQHLAELNKRLFQKSKTTSDEIFKNMNEAMVVIDQKLNIIQNNNAFNMIVENKSDLVNKNILKFDVGIFDSLKKYIDELTNNQLKSVRYKTVDRSRYTYTLNISVIELSQSENGYVILINKHALPWGTVFDSITKKPISLVLVRLMDGVNKRVIETKVTDREGRFGFIVATGKYYIFVSKEGYAFPSIKSKQGYKGAEIEIKSDSEGVIKIDVPIDKTSTEK